MEWNMALYSAHKQPFFNLPKSSAYPSLAVTERNHEMKCSEVTRSEIIENFDESLADNGIIRFGYCPLFRNF